jgi:hypothetical protein
MKKPRLSGLFLGYNGRDTDHKGVICTIHTEKAKGSRVMKTQYPKLTKSLTVAVFLGTVFMGQTSVAHAQDWRKGAEGREVDCQLTVKGKTYLKGTCMYDADKDGSFRLFGDKYFVYLNTLDKGLAGASWNENPKSSHAQVPLGEDFKRDGGCWVGKKAKICAWDKKDANSKSSKKSAPTRIKFAKGAVSATVTGKLTGFESEQSYVIAVGKGQTLKVDQVNDDSDYTTVYLTAPNGEDAGDLAADCHNHRVIKPTLAGDYTINVSECKKADPWKGAYTLKVTVK